VAFDEAAQVARLTELLGDRGARVRRGATSGFGQGPRRVRAPRNQDRGGEERQGDARTR
jgi:hypothetical protein